MRRYRAHYDVIVMAKFRKASGASSRVLEFSYRYENWQESRQSRYNMDPIDITWKTPDLTPSTLCEILCGIDHFIHRPFLVMGM